MMAKLRNLGKLIISARGKYGLTQQQFADLVGVSDRSVGRWECGTRPRKKREAAILAMLSKLERQSTVGKHGSVIDISRAQLPVTLAMRHLKLTIDVRED